MTFDELLQNTAMSFIQALGCESIVYIKPATGGDISIIATGGNLTGNIQDIATDGVIQEDMQSGISRTINAIIDRDEADPFIAGRGKSPKLIVIIANDSTNGIALSEIDTNKDKITVPLKYGGETQQRRITKIISMDAGMITLEVR